jgi:hypothetical protein
MDGNVKVTIKLAIQLVGTARETALGLAAWLKISVTKNQGMEPAPAANRMM